MPTPAPAPAPAPSPHDVLIDTIVAKPDPTRLDDLKDAIKNHSLDALDALAEKINAHTTLQTSPDKLAEFKVAIKERIEVLKLAMHIDQRLTILENRLHLIALLPELAPPKSWTQQATEGAVGFAKMLLAPFQGDGFIGGLANKASAWFSDPKNLKWLRRGFWNVVASPSIVGISESNRFIGGVIAKAKEKLAEMDATDTILDVVETEKNVPPLNNITFDEIFNNAPWIGVPTNQRTPEKLQEMTQYFIAEQRKKGLGTPDSPIIVRMALLMDPTKAAEVAAEQQALQEAEELEQLQTAVADSIPSVSTVTFGTETSAKKEGGKWSLVIERENVDETIKTIDDGTNAAHLLEAIDKLPDVDEIVIQNEGVTIDKSSGKTKISLSVSSMGLLDKITSMNQNFTAGRAHTLHIGVDAGMRPDIPYVIFDQGRRTLNVNTKAIDIISQNPHMTSLLAKVTAAGSRQEWKWEGTPPEWIES